MNVPTGPRPSASTLQPISLPRRAIVTAGGTEEPIDDVRVITNLSRGSFGVTIARELARRGVETTLLGSQSARGFVRPDDTFQVRSFRTVADLERELRELGATFSPQLVMMAAAVSDYSPVPTAGKISSSANERTIMLRRNPKLLDSLREIYGIESFLVGFKLTSGSSTAELIEKAAQQITRSRTNLTVANDLAQIRKTAGQHPILMVTPEGGAIPVNGSREEVARSLVDFIAQRHSVRWFRTATTTSPTPPDPQPQAAAAELLTFAQSAKLLTNNSGNVSARAVNGTPTRPALVVSPRQVNKSTLVASDLVPAEVDLSGRVISAHPSKSSLKSSIDTGMQAILYSTYPQIQSLLHFHPGHQLVLPSATTQFPYPCGTVEEAAEVHRAISEHQPGAVSNFLVQLVHHGYLLGLERDGIQRIQEEWRAIQTAHDLHLDSIGVSRSSIRWTRHPVFVGATVMGLLARHEEGWSSLFLRPDGRGSGCGEQLLDLLIDRGDTIGVHAGCKVRPFYVNRGYKPTTVTADGVELLTPPSRRDDLRPAASVALVDTVNRKVFLTERTVEPWMGNFSFPGGSPKQGESPIQTALRECREECGIDLQHLFPNRSRTVYVGTPDGARAYQITNFCFHLQYSLPHQLSSEIGARSGWFTLSDALKLPMGSGTKSILRGLARQGLL